MRARFRLLYDVGKYSKFRENCFGKASRDTEYLLAKYIYLIMNSVVW
ncbi:hypothetical protein Pjdr2_1426 [Paenibacillus sp. JDR-2]|nr:hypothetical protein Pjdr2_1426 [Paenibacillus sp. JDR-2]